jgi:hypothetical protein
MTSRISIALRTLTVRFAAVAPLLMTQPALCARIQPAAAAPAGAARVLGAR